MISQAISTTEHHNVCTWWKAYTFDNPIRKLLHQPHNVLGDYVKADMTVMDVGCGMGHFSIGMAKLVGESGKVIATFSAEGTLRACAIAPDGETFVAAGASGRVHFLRLEGAG